MTTTVSGSSVSALMLLYVCGLTRAVDCASRTRTRGQAQAQDSGGAPLGPLAADTHSKSLYLCKQCCALPW
jgi:hypothetical protein